MVVTGIRSEYNLLYPIMEAIDEHPRINSVDELMGLFKEVDVVNLFMERL